MAGLEPRFAWAVVELSLPTNPENVGLHRLCGSSGGKTHIASTLAPKATQAGMKTRFITAADPMFQLAFAKAQGRRLGSAFDTTRRDRWSYGPRRSPFPTAAP
jgi:hypothetical protein